MPSAEVEAAFRTRVEQNWTETLIVGSNGVTSTPDDGRAFLLIQYPVENSSRQALTKRRFEEGVARIILNVPTGQGLEIWLPKAGTLSALFRGDKLVFDGVEAFEPSLPIINDDNDNGQYFELAVVVPYRRQFDVA